MTDNEKLIEAFKEMCDPPIPDRDVELLKKVIKKFPIKDGVDIEALPVTENGVYTAEEGKAYSPVVVNVSGGSSELAKDLIERTKTVLDIRDSGATSIGIKAFAGNELLEDVIFPEGLANIGDNAFRECPSLDLTSLPEGLTSIGAGAFMDCPSLTLTSLPESLTSIGAYAFNFCSSLALTSLPEGITEIGEGAFDECSYLALTSLPEGLTSIKRDTFRFCSSLAITAIPEGIVEIGNGAFMECSSLESITFKGNVQTIGYTAFDYCTGITKYSFINNTSVPSNSCLFYDINENCKIVVPDALYDEWVAASGWWNLADHIIKQSEDV